MFLTIHYPLPQWMRTWKIWGKKVKGYFAHHVSQLAHRPREEEGTFRKIPSMFCGCGYGSTDLMHTLRRQRNSTYQKLPTCQCFKFATGSSTRVGEYCRRWFDVKDATLAIIPSREERMSKIRRLTACINEIYRLVPSHTSKKTLLGTIRSLISASIEDSSNTWGVVVLHRKDNRRTATVKCRQMNITLHKLWMVSVVSIY